MKKYTQSIVIAAIILLFGSAAVFAHTGQDVKADDSKSMPMMGMMGQSMGMTHGNPITTLLDLGLSNQQIEALVEQYAATLKRQLPAMRKRSELIHKLAELRASDAPDVKQLRSALEDFGKVNAELEVEAVTSRESALKVLNPEQRQKLADSILPWFSDQYQGCGMMGQGMGSGMRCSHMTGSGNSGSGMMGPGMMGSGMMGGGMMMRSDMMQGGSSNSEKTDEDHQSHH